MGGLITGSGIIAMPSLGQTASAPTPTNDFAHINSLCQSGNVCLKDINNLIDDFSISSYDFCCTYNEDVLTINFINVKNSAGPIRKILFLKELLGKFKWHVSSGTFSSGLGGTEDFEIEMVAY